MCAQATLGRGASLEQWASWLDACVRAALAPHERAEHEPELAEHAERAERAEHAEHAGYTARARRLLLDWSFYSSLVIRELTLRSAASFGSFHLIRLLYDEYVSYLIERRVAAHKRVPPIAVMHRVLEEDDDLSEDNMRADVEEEEGEWDWEDEEEDDDDPIECKKSKMHCE
ncbi:hypothetical protein O3G_MSEX000918 [Manduca sexta]|nr:hypothetical protein O3G_MSEX000918 [Manduca sexta]